MKRIAAGIFVGIFLILSGGGINYHFGLPIKPLDVSLLVVGIVILLATIAAATIIFLRQKSRKTRGPLVTALILSILCTADACAETIHAGTLTPPNKWSILQWNPNAVSGLGAWGCTLLFIACFAIAYAILWYFFRGCFQRPQKKGGDCLEG
ncbi:MAG: hypothetical protein WC726_02940 [Parcubacteria group bacterium]|jgi:hypothetical protein